MRLVVFGWGNEARGDDGLGPALLARFTAADWPETTTVEDYQLQIEHALDLEGADCALFVDAGKNTPAPFSFSRLAPRRDMTHTTHALAPEAVLAVYAQVIGEPPPPAFALCLRGESFALGEGLSPEGAESAGRGVDVRPGADARTLARSVGSDDAPRLRLFAGERETGRERSGRRIARPGIRAEPLRAPEGTWNLVKRGQTSTREPPLAGTTLQTV